MSKDIWVISDTHFGDEEMLILGVRSFETVDIMDDFIVDRWNSVVKPQDKVYHLGDVAMQKKKIATIARCQGHKRLVRGNHDIFDTKIYLPYFKEIYGVRVFVPDLILSHIPIHPESLKETWTNVHGHVHNSVLSVGEKYFNVSAEVINYTPIHIEEIRKQRKAI